MSTRPRLDRRAALAAMATEPFDVAIIGGGVVGVGCALDAAARGLRVALVERHDYASGTSSKSSKLIHGGLRYLQQGHLRLVYEALAERQRLVENAPHVVEMLPFLLPIFRHDGFIDRRVARALGAAMWGYDLTGGFRYGKLHDRLSLDETIARFPTLDRENISHSYLYYDARADDARLVLTAARTAVLHGAVLANYAEVTGVRRDSAGRVNGLFVRADAAEFALRARAIVNATGVWSDAIARLAAPESYQQVRPAKGIHLTFPSSRIQASVAAVIPVPGERRTLFVIPWGEHTYVGTTDTDYAGDLDHPQCEAADVEYVLRALNAALTTDVCEGDIVGRWAGLRPLLQQPGRTKTTDLSRRHAVTRSPEGLITVNGGKLTTFRKMAADTIDVVMDQLGRRGRSLTEHLPLYGADGEVDRELDELGPTEPLVRGTPYGLAHILHAARYEGAHTLDDVLSRRTRLRIQAAAASVEIAADVARVLGAELGWTSPRIQSEVDSYRAAVRAEAGMANVLR